MCALMHVHDRLPQRALLDILTRTAYLLGWHHHFGPASGSDSKIRDALARYVLTAFAYCLDQAVTMVKRRLLVWQPQR